MTMNCIIIDDEPIARKVLQEYLEDVPFLHLAGEFDNPLKAQANLDKQETDLIFLDINMPKINGIDFLRISSTLPMVIITTAYEEYALDGFKLDVLDYLVKPFSFERFLKACNKAKDYRQLRLNAESNLQKQENYFFVKCNGRIEKVFYDDLLFAEASLNYVTLHTVNGKMIVYLTIKGMMESLPAEIFLKVHKSFIINLKKIRNVEGNMIRIANAEIPISQNFHDEVMKAVLKDKLIKR